MCQELGLELRDRASVPGPHTSHRPTPGRGWWVLLSRCGQASCRRRQPSAESEQWAGEVCTARQGREKSVPGRGNSQYKVTGRREATCLGAAGSVGSGAGCGGKGMGRRHSPLSIRSSQNHHRTACSWTNPAAGPARPGALQSTRVENAPPGPASKLMKGRGVSWPHGFGRVTSSV